MVRFLFTVVLEKAPNQPRFGGNIGDVEEHTYDLFARNQRFRLADAHYQIFVAGSAPHKTADTDLSTSAYDRGLRPLLELPVELVLPTHGSPTDQAALERALTA